ncbi:MAG TPA: hypothetical protein VJT09_19445 [Pyrinomonadaceae bacterium]|nr:hypothetical protein [Pyrinomonadaceae bacterium]
MSTLETAGLLIPAAAVLLDLLSLFLALAVRTKGHGRSGLPLVSWLLYMLYGLRPIAPKIDNVLTAILIIALLTIFHVLCHYAVPVLHLKYLQNRE